MIDIGRFVDHASNVGRPCTVKWTSFGQQNFSMNRKKKKIKGESITRERERDEKGVSYISLHYGTEGGPGGPVKIKSARQEVKEKKSKGGKRGVQH